VTSLPQPDRSFDAADSGEAGSQAWSRAVELVERAVTPGTNVYGLELIEDELVRAAGAPRNDLLVLARNLTALRFLVAQDLLQRIRGACDGPIILLKGLEIALRYPNPEMRVFGDLDLLVPDSARVQRALLMAGYEEVMDPDLFVDIHHERPLQLPGSPLVIEVHKGVKWPDFLQAPPIDELLDVAIPSRTGITGILALPRQHHAVVTAAHSWAHAPLRDIRHLLDVAILAEGIDRTELRTVARRWGVERVWETTIRTADGLFGNAPRSSAERVWARHLRPLRERTVTETHLEKYASPFWAYPLPMAVQVAGSMLRSDLRPAEGETWGEKLRRARVALRNATRPRSEHDEELGEAARKRRKQGRYTRIG
jgi:hypothetical protein